MRLHIALLVGCVMASAYANEDVFRNLVCQQCHAWCSVEQSNATFRILSCAQCSAWCFHESENAEMSKSRIDNPGLPSKASTTERNNLRESTDSSGMVNLALIGHIVDEKLNGSFRGPQGEPGNQGEQGIPGPIGPPGAVNMTRVREMVEERVDKALSKGCKGVKAESGRSGRVHLTYVPKLEWTDVYCDMTTDGGNWIVFQIRTDGSVDFNRNWNDYVNGFGNVNGEFWLGLEAIHQLTRIHNYELRMDMIEKNTGSRHFIKYNTFNVGPASDNYRLTVSGYSGSMTDLLLNYHNNQQFSTKDADHDSHGDEHCAAGQKGGWWYNKCTQIDLNISAHTAHGHRGHAWYPNKWMDFRFTEMKMRRTG